MQTAAGTISILHEGTYYTLNLPKSGWLAAELVQYLGEVYESKQRRLALLKLLGYTLELSRERPLRRPGQLWVEVDLEARRLETNSPLIREAVDQEDAVAGSSLALRRIYEVLDRYDFTVKLFR